MTAMGVMILLYKVTKHFDCGQKQDYVPTGSMWLYNSKCPDELYLRCYRLSVT